LIQYWELNVGAFFFEFGGGIAKITVEAKEVKVRAQLCDDPNVDLTQG
jgi:hypothetical protein